MSTKKVSTAAVCIPGEGVLVVGGVFYKPSIWERIRRKPEQTYFSKEAQILKGELEGVGDQKWTWLSLPSMTTERINPGMAYFEGSVFVAGGNTGAHYDIEQMRYPTELNTTPQWTVVSLMEVPLGYPCNLFVFNEQMLLLC